MASEKPKLWNFSAGPAILPPVVFERAAEAVRELRADGHAPDAKGVGMSILEISHRSKPYEAVTFGAEKLCHEVLGIPETHQVLFLQGGASLQFAMLAMNLREAGKPAAYIDTGVWSQKAIIESQGLGETRVVASSEATNYDRIPEFPAADAYAGASYLHITTNNTIFGTEYAEIPQAEGGVPLVIDFSSHAGSRPMALENAAFGYAGAQKNIGPSGLTLVLARKDLVDGGRKDIPVIFRYATHAANNSLYHTPPTFAIYLMRNVLAYTAEIGGLDEIERRNRRKGEILYGAIDENPDFFRAPVEKDSRSFMNVVFRLPSEDLEKRFVAEAAKEGMVGLAGHRSTGGIRASIYNAVELASVERLVEFMRAFAARA